MEIDVHISKDELCELKTNKNVEIEDIFSMDVDEDCTQVGSNKVESFPYILDICLKRLFTFMKTTCHNADNVLL